MKALVEFLMKGLCDNATMLPSFGRISCAIVLYFLLCWESYLISKSGVWVDIPANWLILVLAIWAVAKGAETIAKISNQRQREALMQINLPTLPDKYRRPALYTFLGIMLVAVLLFTWKLLFYKPPVTGIYTPPPPAAGMQNVPTHDTAPVVLKAYDKRTAAKKMQLPDAVVSDPKKELVSTAALKPSEGGYTVAAITDTATGETVMQVKEEERPLFGFGGKTEIGALAGVTTSGEAALVYARQDLLRVGPVNLGAAGGAGTIGGKLGAGAFINVKGEW